MVDQDVESAAEFARTAQRRKRKTAPRLQRASKISDYRVRKVVAQFVRDHTAAAAARATGLSVNSVHALYTKLRVFFFEVRLFNDFYGGADPMSYQSDDLLYERDLLEFHARRSAAKRGLAAAHNQADYHFAESCWRFDFALLMRERPSEAVYGMMERHLIEIIHLCGPIGIAPRNRLAGAQAVMRQADERITWLMRNAPSFKSPKDREGLAEALAIADDPE